MSVDKQEVLRALERGVAVLSEGKYLISVLQVQGWVRLDNRRLREQNRKGV